MILSDLSRPLVDQTPICVMARGVLEALWNPQRLDDLFERTAHRQYARSLLGAGVAGVGGDWLPSAMFMG